MKAFSIVKFGGLLSLLAGIYSTPFAWAAEYSTANSPGFSRDGNHFIFEEFDTTDELRAPDVNLFAIDIVQDRWLKGTPTRLQSTEKEVIALEEKMADDGTTDPQDVEARS